MNQATRVTLKPEAVDLLADLLTDEWAIRNQLIDCDSEDMAEWHTNLRAVAADTYQRITGHPLEAQKTLDDMAAFERRIERAFGVTV